MWICFGKTRVVFAMLDPCLHEEEEEVVKHWNSLPENVIMSNNINTFKNRYDEYMTKQWERQHPMSFQLPLPLSYLLGKHLLGKHQGKQSRDHFDINCQHSAHKYECRRIQYYVRINLTKLMQQLILFLLGAIRARIDVELLPSWPHPLGPINKWWGSQSSPTMPWHKFSKLAVHVPEHVMNNTQMYTNGHVCHDT